MNISLDVTGKLTIAAGIGAVALVGTALVASERAWANLVVTACYLMTLGLGGALFIALTNVTGAEWSTAFRRVPEAMTGLLPDGGALTLLAVLTGRSRYGWHHHGEGDEGSLDLYVMVFPPVTGHVPVFGLPEVVSMLCVASDSDCCS